MEKNLTIRTAYKDFAEDLRTSLMVYFGRHINFTWWEGAWELSLDADEKELNEIAEEFKGCDDFKEGVFTFTID